MKILNIFLAILFASSCNSSQIDKNNTLMAAHEPLAIGYEEAVFGGGCFWCIEAMFENLKGVQSVSSGYAGGKTENPSYEEVSSGKSGHVEVARIVFDPKIITYAQLVDIFWHVHDPTTLNQQGNDVGEQYRSAIFYVNEGQKQIAEKSFQESQSSDLWNGKKYTTTIEPLTKFYPAEAYHQDYYVNNKSQPYCSFVVGPKVKKFKEQYKDLLKEDKEHE